ncbi:Glycogen debranching enzyme [Prochlorococcus marinus str. MIT 9321]|uniref:Glycogen debranching enzyme n=1 Tax=Prochlorococcus marinus str. MIT 9401 TaxID=167551 RepID=A0A0A2B9A2_PROMR|nr:isoamylase [Prochlorococcus marinus]KGG02756.1 Glycogen debranching enzyme [Prochlorococcus marinus str. MIT 9321]KGG05390.1 Glycogen debranching enzyme [Prochlorococcus marinus str. MIT 9322]KGG10451.1 Glycogen debranching enzyme [Prochlorococcus marinus str. MIT 9401]
MTHINKGNPFPLGSSLTSRGVNFSLIATNAEYVEILFFEKEDSIFPKTTLKLDKTHNTGPYWHVEIKNLNEGCIYAYRIKQKNNEINNNYEKKVLLDPCSRGISGWESYKRENALKTQENTHSCLKSVVCDRKLFNFKDYPRPKHSWEETIIYELHIKSFTESIDKNESCCKKFLKKIPYLKELGITTIELLPIFCFDPTDAPNGLKNFWGYSPINWFTPHFEYLSNESAQKNREEFRRLVEECHKADIEVILDVVYNHTSEGDSQGPAISWKGIDENLYYFIGEDKNYQDVSGCGNTIAANRGLVRKLIIESLKCWSSEFGIDGFRFDLGIALSRGENLSPLDNPPLFEDIECEPELVDIKFISEPWDCGGLYKLGDFPSKNTFTWNGHFRDDLRKFWKGDKDTAWNMSDKIKGSPSIYKEDKILPKSINFITSHDGFTLKDLVTFNRKHNFANSEQNRDGDNHNNSWNHGIEGPTSNLLINDLRKRQQKNLILSLLISKGVPMVLMGDEIGRSQGGNNNSWCQNNLLGWMNWEHGQQDLELLEYFKYVIKIRKKLIDFFNPSFFPNNQPNQKIPTYHWHGTKLDSPDWSSWSHTIAFSLNKGNTNPQIWIGLNAYSNSIDFPLPKCKYNWLKVIDTSMPSIFEPLTINEKTVSIKSRSSLLIISEEVFGSKNNIF